MSTLTVFTALREEGFYKAEAESLSDFLRTLAEWTVESGFVYDVWVQGGPWGPDGRKTREQSIDESIAAGRVIELVDGVYVARGVEEEAKPVESLGALLRRALGRQGVVKPQFIGIDWAKDALHPADAAMIARDGPAKPAYVTPPAPEAKSTTKTPHAAIASLTRVSAMGSRLGGFSVC